MIILKSENKMIEFYYVSSKRNGINFDEKSLFKGHIILDNNHDTFTIHDIVITKYSDVYSFTDDEFIDLIKREDVYVVNEYYPLTQMLKQENVTYNRIAFCKKCAQNNTIRLLTKNNSYYYNSDSLCKKCANILLKKLIIINGYLDFADRNNNFLLEKYHNIDDIIKIMDEGFNPVDNDGITLYDTLPVTENPYEKVKIDDLNIPQDFKEILSQRINTLLPVQILSIKEGLLENENLLVVSQTGSGKTLVGELAGITSVMNQKRMIYLSPLVALANQKYKDFKRYYEKMGLTVAIKVGHNRIKSEDELFIKDKNIKDADIIVATYEGLDFLLRSGKHKDIENLGCVVIDEIQMLENEERGHRLNGLIYRIRTLFPNAQLIGLSATIKNADSLANDFCMKLVKYDKRPVKLERHFLNVKNIVEKNRFITNLCKKEFDTISSKGYHGQTIIFTDSRRKTQLISSRLNKEGVKSEFYHAGLTYKRKLEIEDAFEKQKISTVVTTSALASGVDFPASQVIFDSIHMGMEYLTNNEFHQMLGRAGRPSYHDTGRAYIIVVSKDNDDSSDENEYDTALNLLKCNVNAINVLYDEMDVYESVLSDICVMDNVDMKSLRIFYENLWIPITFDEAIQLLIDEKMIYYDKPTSTYHPSEYGKAVSKSFINIKEARIIKNNIYNDLTDTILKINLIRNVYLSNGVINRLSSTMNIKTGSNVFSQNTRKIIEEGRYINRLGQRYENKLINIIRDLMTCDCSSPYCHCFEEKISKHIINRRFQGWDPKNISNEFKREYELVIYSGDIYSYLNQVVMTLEAVKRISYSLNINSTGKNCEKLIKKLEDGKNITLLE